MAVGCKLCILRNLRNLREIIEHARLTDISRAGMTRPPS
jgi:hypothetical protein